MKRKREDNGRHESRRPLITELDVQQHDDVSMINAKSKRRSDRSLQIQSAPTTPCTFTSIWITCSLHLTSLHFHPSSTLLYHAFPTAPIIKNQKPQSPNRSNPFLFPKNSFFITHPPTPAHTSPKEIKDGPPHRRAPLPPHPDAAAPQPGVRVGLGLVRPVPLAHAREHDGGGV